MQKRKQPQPAQLSNSQGSEPIRFNRKLIQGMTREEIEDFEVRWKSSGEVRKLILRVLTRRLEDGIIGLSSEELLNSPNYLATVADQLGYQRGLREAMKLLTNQEKDHDD